MSLPPYFKGKALPTYRIEPEDTYRDEDEGLLFGVGLAAIIIAAFSVTVTLAIVSAIFNWHLFTLFAL